MSANTTIANIVDNNEKEEILSFAVYSRINEIADACIHHVFWGDNFSGDVPLDNGISQIKYEDIENGIKMMVCAVLNHNFTFAICYFTYYEHYEFAVNHVGKVIERLQLLGCLKKTERKITCSKESYNTKEDTKENTKKDTKENTKKDTKENIKEDMYKTTINISTENRYSGEIINKLSIIRIVCSQLTHSNVQNNILREAIDINRLITPIKKVYNDNLVDYDNKIKNIFKNKSSYIKVLNKK